MPRVRRAGAMWAAAALAAVAVTTGAAPATAAVTPEQATALGREAYLYGFPVLEFLRVRSTATSVRCPDGRGNGPLNTFSNATRFTTPRDRTIVAPNVDTLYSIAHLDLGRGPVVLSHPAMGRRYFSFQFLDPYTNTIGYVGTARHAAAAPAASRSPGPVAPARGPAAPGSSALPTGGCG